VDDELTWHVLLELLPSTVFPLEVKVAPLSEMDAAWSVPVKTGLLRGALNASPVSTYCVDATRVELSFAGRVGTIGGSAKVFTPDHDPAPKLWQTLASSAKVGSWLLMTLIALKLLAIPVASVCRLLDKSRPPRLREGAVNAPVLTPPLTVKLVRVGVARKLFQLVSQLSSLVVLLWMFVSFV
jgi:hypothetical protein